jgi:hypothetical protein
VTETGLVNGLKEYGYDTLGRLTSVEIDKTTKKEYLYDDTHGRLSSFNGTTMEYDNRGRLTDFGSTTLTYDNYGNRLTKGTTEYTWTRGHLLDTILGVSEYKYDKNGKRISGDEYINGKLCYKLTFDKNDHLMTRKGESGSGETVKFKWRDYKDNNKMKEMTVTIEEFIRRYLLHILPPGFMKIRYYGILGNRNKKKKLLKCKILTRTQIYKNKKLPALELLKQTLGKDFNLCSHCKKGHMLISNTT